MNFQYSLANLSFLSLLIAMVFYWVGASFSGFSINFKNLNSFNKADFPKGQGPEDTAFDFNPAFFSVLIANILLTLLLVMRWVESGHFPLSNLYESLMFLSWCFTILHLVIVKTTFSTTTTDLKKKKMFQNLIGSITTPSALLTNAFATFNLPKEMQEVLPLVPALQSNWLMMHVTVMILSYAALILGSLLAIAFLIVTTNSVDKKKAKPLSTPSLLPYQTPLLIKNAFPLNLKGLLLPTSPKKAASSSSSSLLSALVSPTLTRGQFFQTKEKLKKRLGFSLSLINKAYNGLHFTSEDKEGIKNNKQTTGDYLSRIKAPILIKNARENFGTQALKQPLIPVQGKFSAQGSFTQFQGLSSLKNVAYVLIPFFNIINNSQSQVQLKNGFNLTHTVENTVDKQAVDDLSYMHTPIAYTLDNLSYRILGIGFPLLTIGILSGAVWANEAWGTYWSWDPKETWALLTWLIFAIYLHTRITKGWAGRKPAIIASFGFVVVWVCYLGVNLLGEGLHSYGWLS